MSVELEPFSLSLSHPFETASGTVERRNGFVVRLEVDGTVGVGEATPLPGWTESRSTCEATLRCIDDPVAALEDDRLDGTPAARHGLSLAMLDARARAREQPLYRYLGGPAHVDSVPVNATIGDGSPRETAARVDAAIEAEFRVVKIKVGKRHPSEDLDRLEAVRSSAPDVEIRIDANGGWDPSTVDRILPTLASLDVAVLEQPLPAETIDGHGRLRGRGVDIALDEGVLKHGPHDVIESNAADLLVCKPMALGGIDVARRTIVSAREAGIDGIVSTTIDGAIARRGAVHLAASIPDVRACGLATGDLLETDLLETPLEVSDGRIAVPQGKDNIPPR